MSEVLDVTKAHASQAKWIILDCGHWYKWTGENKPPAIGEELPCPTCQLPRRGSSDFVPASGGSK